MVYVWIQATRCTSRRVAMQRTWVREELHRRARALQRTCTFSQRVMIWQSCNGENFWTDPNCNPTMIHLALDPFLFNSFYPIEICAVKKTREKKKKKSERRLKYGKETPKLSAAMSWGTRVRPTIGLFDQQNPYILDCKVEETLSFAARHARNSNKLQLR